MSEKKKTRAIIEYDYKAVSEKPHRTYRANSKYDPILEKFSTGKDDMIIVNVRGKDSNYVRTQLNKRVEKNKLSMKISVVNNIVYLEKERVVILKAPVK